MSQFVDRRTRSTSRTAYAVALAVLAIGGCSQGPKQNSLADLPEDRIATEDTAGNATPTDAPVEATGASARGTGEVPSIPKTIAPPKRPSGDFEAPALRNPASSRHGDPGPGSAAPNPDTPEPEEVGPAAAYEDAAGDAHGGSGIGSVSQSSFDVVRVGWNPVSYEERGRRGYSTSVTLAGPARKDGAYVSYGSFPSGSGDECQLYHILELGARAYAHAFCGSIEDGTRRFLGRMDGRPVTSRPTAAGGTTLVGTFDDPVVPYELETADRRLYSLSAFTAMCSPSPERCATFVQVWDWASSTLTFRV